MKYNDYQIGFELIKRDGKWKGMILVNNDHEYRYLTDENYQLEDMFLGKVMIFDFDSLPKYIFLYDETEQCTEYRLGIVTIEECNKWIKVLKGSFEEIVPVYESIYPSNNKESLKATKRKNDILKKKFIRFEIEFEKMLNKTYGLIPH